MARQPTIVVIGATGFTGRRVARELAGDGAPFVIAGRDAARLERLRVSLGSDAACELVDVTDPASLRRLVRAGDAVINCAGPFEELGEPVVRACVDAGAHYLDTTGEQPFMRVMHRRYHEPARGAGVSVVNGMAFEYALGDCAASLAASRLAEPLRSIDVVYAWLGSASSVGTRRTSVRILGRRAWSLEDGSWRRRPLGARRRPFTVASGRRLHAVTFGAGEVVTVPRHVEVRTVRGWLALGPRAARLLPLLAPALPVLVPALRPIIERIATRGGDPDPDHLEQSRFTIRVEAEDHRAARAAVEVRGRDPYGLTAAIAVAGARRALEPDATRGVLAPAELVDPAAFLDALAPLGLEVERTR